MDIKIEKGIPLPPRVFGPTLKTQYRRWPFNQMEVGDSFFYASDKPYRARTDVMGAARRFAGGKIATRDVEGGIRVWRIA